MDLFNSQNFTRRDVLDVSVKGGLGFLMAHQLLGKTQMVWAQDKASDAKKQSADKDTAIKSVIFIMLTGGPSHIDTFDPKPGAPTGGPYKQAKTSVDGCVISEHLPRLAKLMKHITLVRSMTSPEGSHARARHLQQSGYTPQGPVRFPAFGSIIAKERCPDSLALPAYVSLGGKTMGGGYLGAKYSPFVIGRPGQQVANMELPANVSRKRFERRRGLLIDQEQDFAHGRKNKLIEGHLNTYERAAKLMNSETRKAFDLTQVKQKVKDKFGSDRFGQSCLVARRLVEKGVPFVSITLGGWDTHRDNFEKVKVLSEQLDRGLGNLLQDLVDRDMLKSTAFLCSGEFGRTPRINPNTGRDHWPKAFSALIGGGGLPQGKIYGKTDDRGALVAENPVRPHDLLATLATKMGMDRNKVYHSDIGRPFRLIDQKAKVIKDLLS